MEHEPDVDAPTAAETPAARAADAPAAPAENGGSGGDDEAVTRASEERTTIAGSGRGHSALHSATAMRALKAEELLRARGFGRVIALLTLVALTAVTLMARVPTGQPRWMTAISAATLGSCGILAAWVWARVRRTSHPQRMLRLFGAFALINSLWLQYYAGVFSPAPTIIAMGISYFGLADDRSFGYAMCIGSSIVYGALAGLVTVGALPDYGLFRVAGTPPMLRVVAIFTALGVYAVMLWQARLSRNATHEAVERLDQALRLVQQREALLEEANQNLDVALAAGGRRGAYTGRAVGPYQLGEVLGRGGMGEVYAATHSDSGIGAAVKLLHGKALGNPGVVARFLREAELAMRLRAPNLVEIYELGQADDGAPFIAMELLKGNDLGWHLRRRRALPLADLVELAAQIASGLDVAHRESIIHRDLKPANIFRSERAAGEPPQWKILDFGVAKLRGSSGTLTQRALIGTPGYMSPEQARGRDVDPRSDLFSLGAVLYRALTGRPPFSGPDMPQVLFDIVYRSPTRPSEIVNKLPPDVDLFLAIALAKDGADRFLNATELAEAFRAAARGDLSPRLRARGQEQVRQLPWGQTARPR